MLRLRRTTYYTDGVDIDITWTPEGLHSARSSGIGTAAAIQVVDSPRTISIVSPHSIRFVGTPRDGQPVVTVIADKVRGLSVYEISTVRYAREGEATLWRSKQ